MAPKKVMKKPMAKNGGEEEETKKGIKRPAGTLDVTPLSLEEKMEKFQKSKDQNVLTFLDELSEGQRQSLWQKFKRAREALADPMVSNLWNTQCKGEGSDPMKKRLLKVFLQSGGELKNSQLWQKEMVTLSKSSGPLAIMHLAFFDGAFWMFPGNYFVPRFQN